MGWVDVRTGHMRRKRAQARGKVSTYLESAEIALVGREQLSNCVQVNLINIVACCGILE